MNIIMYNIIFFNFFKLNVSVKSFILNVRESHGIEALHIAADELFTKASKLDRIIKKNIDKDKIIMLVSSG